MDRIISFCDKCGKQLTDPDVHRGDRYGIFLQGLVDKTHLSVHTNRKTTAGSSSKAGYTNGSCFCSEPCLAHAINRMLSDANIRLKVVPILEEIS